jgi:hypothetical protein
MYSPACVLTRKLENNFDSVLRAATEDMEYYFGKNGFDRSKLRSAIEFAWNKIPVWHPSLFSSVTPLLQISPMSTCCLVTPPMTPIRGVSSVAVAHSPPCSPSVTLMYPTTTIACETVLSQGSNTDDDSKSSDSVSVDDRKDDQDNDDSGCSSSKKEKAIVRGREYNQRYVVMVAFEKKDFKAVKQCLACSGDLYDDEVLPRHKVAKEMDVFSALVAQGRQRRTFVHAQYSWSSKHGKFHCKKCGNSVHYKRGYYYPTHRAAPHIPKGHICLDCAAKMAEKPNDSAFVNAPELDDDFNVAFVVFKSQRHASNCVFRWSRLAVSDINFSVAHYFNYMKCRDSLKHGMC